MPVRPSLASPGALAAHEAVIFPEAELARSAAFILSAAEGGNQYLPALRSQPERFEPNSRERLLAGAMIPSAWYLQAQRFRRHAQQAFKALFAHADVLIAPATPCSATPIGAQTMEINGQPLPDSRQHGDADPAHLLPWPARWSPCRCVRRTVSRLACS